MIKTEPTWLDLSSFGRREAFGVWMQNQSSDDDFAICVFRRADSMFVSGGLSNQMGQERDWRAANMWSFFCWNLASKLRGLLDRGTHRGLVRAVFREFVELSLCLPPSEHALPLAIFLGKWQLADYGILQEQFEVLLPTSVLPDMDDVKVLMAQRAKEAAEREYERMNSGPAGY